MARERRLMQVGERHGRLVLLKNIGVDRRHHSVGQFRCDCGQMSVLRLGNVRAGNNRSCGCTRWSARRLQSR